MKNFFYRVNEGDTTRSISIRFNMPLYDLITKNRLDCEVQAGDMLYVERCDSVYSVKIGDTINSLAKKVCISEEELLSKVGFPYLFYGLLISI